MSVFANGLEVSGKATPNKTIAAMPDVCMSPPPPPAGPVPIPYPLFGMASDTTDGCTSVFVKGKEAGKKNSTKYSKTTGNEPATNSFGANVITHKITGPLKFAAYSFDVIFEGGGACRFSDLTTQNHMNGGGGSTQISMATPSVGEVKAGGPCAVLSQANKDDFKAIEEFANDPNSNVSDPDRKALKKFKSSGTITHSMVTPAGGRSSIVPGTSNSVVRRLAGKKYAAPAASDGESMGRRKRIASQICDGSPPYRHPKGGSHAHSEPCILDSIGPVTPTATVIMSIEWHKAFKKGGKRRTAMKNIACGHCKKTIRHACRCMDIKICDSKGNPQDACPKKKK